MPGERAHGDGNALASRRSLSYVAGLLHILQAVLLLAALPVIAMMFLGSLWEGGDTELKQRIVDWGLLAGPATIAGAGLFAATAVTVLRRRPGQRPLALASAILLAVLAAGWAWTFQGNLVSDRSTLGQWALLTLPGLVGCAIVIAGEPPS
ncbi:hypothetical protein [Terrabacter sp. 2YAF2]|uniref:hypothetical protein n=1 Tax=Terrabacter sp. 2YAF2 TaxID=3233026 RepID=UPI003F995C79